MASCFVAEAEKLAAEFVMVEMLLIEEWPYCHRMQTAVVASLYYLLGAPLEE